MAVPQDGWSLETLKTYVETIISRTDTQIESLDRLMQSQRADDMRALETAVETQAEALRVARTEMDARLEKLNELRDVLGDAQSQLMPRAEAKLLIDALVARVEAIQKGVADLSSVIASLRSGLSGQNVGIQNAQQAGDRARTLVFAVLGIVMVIVGVAVTLWLGLR